MTDFYRQEVGKNKRTSLVDKGNKRVGVGWHGVQGRGSTAGGKELPGWLASNSQLCLPSVCAPSSVKFSLPGIIIIVIIFFFFRFLVELEGTIPSSPPKTGRCCLESRASSRREWRCGTIIYLQGKKVQQRTLTTRAWCCSSEVPLGSARFHAPKSREVLY